MLLVIGMLAALVERGTSGEGQVVDAAMVDGSALLMSIFFAIDQMGAWGPRGTNLLDGGSHWYGVYETADGGYVSVAAFEPQFYAEFLRVMDSRPRSRATDGPRAVARTQGTGRGAVQGQAPATSGSRSCAATRSASRRCSP